MSITIRGATVTTFAAGAALFLAVPREPASAQVAHISVAGQWQLNAEKSEKYDPSRDRNLSRDDPTGSTLSTGQHNGRAATQKSGPPRGGGSAGDAAGSAGGAAGAGTGAMDRHTRDAWNEATRQPRTLRIEQTDSSVTIGDMERSLVVPTNGQSVTDTTLDGDVIYAVKATWKKDQLVVEKVIDGGTSVRSTYYFDKKDPKTLIVDVHFDSKSMHKTLDNRRVYNAAAGS